VPLHVNQMEELELDISAYPETMADALAVMHWGAKIDANDVEFVLAPPRSTSPSSSSSSSSFSSPRLGEHVVWLLDFDCCRAIAMDEAGVEHACAPFLTLIRYIRGQIGRKADQVLWEKFKGRYLETSRGFWGRGVSLGDSLGGWWRELRRWGGRDRRTEGIEQRDESSYCL
jgi:hypothetical protein